jgi:hypothetical protein
MPIFLFDLNYLFQIFVLFLFKQRWKEKTRANKKHFLIGFAIYLLGESEVNTKSPFGKLG